MSFGIPPPEKPESLPPPDYWGWFVFHVQEVLGMSDGLLVFFSYLLGVPGFAIYAGQKGVLTGMTFLGGTLFCFLAITAFVAVFVVPLVALHMVAEVVGEREKQAKHRAALDTYAKDLADWKEALQRWEEGAPAREASARAAAKAAHFTGVYYSLIKAYQEGAKAAVARRLALEAQVGEMFLEYRLRNDWDASDPTLVPRLQSTFRAWMRDTPPFPPEDMALLALSPNRDTQALLPPPTACSP